MKHPFLESNELILIDYIPGSSGQLLMRLWSELDPTMDHDNPIDFTETTIRDHPASVEVHHDIVVPKKITNWFLDMCEPHTIDDYASYLDMLSTILLATRHRWLHASGGRKFYETLAYRPVDERVIYGMHAWDRSMPIDEMKAIGYRVRCISLVPTTERGIRYQYGRAQICYPGNPNGWAESIKTFNSKRHSETLDLCTMLVDRDTDGILRWLETNIGEVRREKLAFARTLIDAYYNKVLDRMGI